MIRKAAGPLGQYWKDLPWWTKNGPLGITFLLFVAAVVLLFMDWRANEQQRVIDERNAMLKQTAAIQSLAADRREQTRLLEKLVELEQRPGNEKWAELNVLLRNMNKGVAYDQEDLSRIAEDIYRNGIRVPEARPKEVPVPASGSKQEGSGFGRPNGT